MSEREKAEPLEISPIEPSLQERELRDWIAAHSVSETDVYRMLAVPAELLGPAFGEGLMGEAERRLAYARTWDASARVEVLRSHTEEDAEDREVTVVDEARIASVGLFPPES